MVGSKSSDVLSVGLLGAETSIAKFLNDGCCISECRVTYAGVVCLDDDLHGCSAFILGNSW